MLIVIIALCVIFFVLFSKKSKQIKNTKIAFDEYKNATQNQISTLQNTNSLYEKFLSQEKYKNVEIKEDHTQRQEELKQELKEEKQKVDKYIEDIQNDKGKISKLETLLEEQNKAMQEKLELLQDSEAKFKTEFENLANKIFENNSKKLNEHNQKSLTNVLDPVKEQLKDFKQKVEDVYVKESTARGALQNELQNLKNLNQQVTTETRDLTRALTSNNKQQGIWGEMVLEGVLEKSGLRKGSEYFSQESIKNDENKNFRPDVIVKLTNDRDIIIDAKTSLVTYNNYITATDDKKQACLKAHIISIKKHIKDLSDKKYETLKGVNSLDFIFMFVPIEGALVLALGNDGNLYDEAFKQKIMLVSPTSLLVSLRAVENTWRHEKQAKNIADVYDRAAKLYDKFTGFVEDCEKIGKSLNNANKSYESAFGKLKSGSGNLIGQAEKLKNIANIKPPKNIDKNLIETAMTDFE